MSLFGSRILKSSAEDVRCTDPSTTVPARMYVVPGLARVISWEAVTSSRPAEKLV